jgi:hypothetical protein
LDECNSECEVCSVLFGCNAFGASLVLSSGGDDITVGGDGVKDLDVVDVELDEF